MTLIEAKAQAYDVIVQLEHWNAKLREITQVIQNLSLEKKEN